MVSLGSRGGARPPGCDSRPTTAAMPHARLQRLQREGTRGAARRREGVGEDTEHHTHGPARGHTDKCTHVRTGTHTTHARLHAPHPRCSGSGDHDGGCGGRLGARVAAAASVAAVMGGRWRGRHGRVRHGWIGYGWGSLVRGSRFGVRGLGFERYIY